MRHFLYGLFHPITFIALVVVVVLLKLLTSPWPMDVTIKHWMSARNCDAAREIGLAPAMRGEPGYWPQHDRDKDGIACEPYFGPRH
jgi:hypothetical protein